MKNGLFFTVCLLFVIPCVFSVPLENIAPSYANQLRSSGSPIMETQLRNPSPKLIPANFVLRQYITEAMRTISPNMMSETLFLYKKPEHSHTDSGVWDETQKTGLFNQLLAISTLTGIQYYSASRGEMRTFFELSQVINNPDSRNPLPDPVFTTLPPELTLYARQRDLTFGDNIYRYDYVNNRDIVFFVQENLTPLNIGIFQAIRRNNLQSFMAVFDCGDSLLIYAVSMARALSVPGMGERIGNSLSNRAEAILKWFTGRADIILNNI